MTETTNDTFSKPIPHNEEDDFLRPEHDLNSLVNRLAEASPIIGAPAFTFYNIDDHFVIVIRKRTS
jgi:hypothetical protein